MTDQPRPLERVPVEPGPRQHAYAHELRAFAATLRGQQPPARSLDHELLVEETLQRAAAAGAIAG